MRRKPVNTIRGGGKLHSLLQSDLASIFLVLVLRAPFLHSGPRLCQHTWTSVHGQNELSHSQILTATQYQSNRGFLLVVFFSTSRGTAIKGKTILNFVPLFSNRNLSDCHNKVGSAMFLPWKFSSTENLGRTGVKFSKSIIFSQPTRAKLTFPRYLDMRESLSTLLPARSTSLFLSECVKTMFPWSECQVSFNPWYEVGGLVRLMYPQRLHMCRSEHCQRCKRCQSGLLFGSCAFEVNENLSLGNIQMHAWSMRFSSKMYYCPPCQYNNSFF